MVAQAMYLINNFYFYLKEDIDMSKEVKTRIVHKHDLEKNWDLASNFIPK